jgi:hypothetical protein
MHRHVTVLPSVGLLVLLGILTMSAQQPAPQQGGQPQRQGGTGAARASALPMFFEMTLVRPASQTGQAKLAQENMGDPNLELRQYGLHESCLLTSGTPGSETTPFSVWSGECQQPFATLFRHKASYVDLTGTAKIRWTVKTSGFHVVRPAVKLADGTLLVGETAAASVPMLVQSEVATGAIRWIALDPKRVVTLGFKGAPLNEIWVQNVDLSRVDEVGFVDLMPASGHGTGGYIHVSQFQVYGRPVARATTSGD